MNKENDESTVDHYRAYVFLLKKLHNSITNNKHKSQIESDNIKSLMDYHWSFLSIHQTIKARAYSERLGC